MAYRFNGDSWNDGLGVERQQVEATRALAEAAERIAAVLEARHSAEALLHAALQPPAAGESTVAFDPTRDDWAVEGDGFLIKDQVDGGLGWRPATAAEDAVLRARVKTRSRR